MCGSAFRTKASKAAGRHYYVCLLLWIYRRSKDDIEDKKKLIYARQIPMKLFGVSL